MGVKVYRFELAWSERSHIYVLADGWDEAEKAAQTEERHMGDHCTWDEFSVESGVEMEPDKVPSGELIFDTKRKELDREAVIAEYEARLRTPGTPEYRKAIEAAGQQRLPEAHP